MNMYHHIIKKLIEIHIIQRQGIIYTPRCKQGLTKHILITAYI